MTLRTSSPDSTELIFVCGLGWPKLTRFFISQTGDDYWELWEQETGASKARPVGGWEDSEGVTEMLAAAKLLDEYLAGLKRPVLPRGEPVPGLLTQADIEAVMRRVRDRMHSNVARFPLA